MPSSGKVPRVPSVVTGHPQGGALRNPSPPDGPKTRPLRFRPRGIFLFACKWSMIGLPRTEPSGDTATVGGSEGPAGWEVNRARPNTPSRRRRRRGHPRTALRLPRPLRHGRRNRGGRRGAFRKARSCPLRSHHSRHHAPRRRRPQPVPPSSGSVVDPGHFPDRAGQLHGSGRWP